MDESEEAICQLIKPGGDPPILLQFVEEAFYYMRFPVPDEVTAAWILVFLLLYIEKVHCDAESRNGSQRPER